VEIAENVGDALPFLVLTDDTQIVIDLCYLSKKKA
jgi:hypothetical protein